MQGNSDGKHSHRFGSIQTGGNPIRKEFEETVLSNTLWKNASWKCGGPCGQQLRWDHVFDDDIKKDMEGTI